MFGQPQLTTVVDGVLTVTAKHHTIAVTGGGDFDVETVRGLEAGDTVLIRMATAGETATFKTGVGNFISPDVVSDVVLFGDAGDGFNNLILFSPDGVKVGVLNGYQSGVN
jgi:hypothetical protein